MLLYVMRHGPAEDRAATGRDADRALTREGREVVRRAARELVKARGARAASLRVLSSPARRACETAETVVGELSPVGSGRLAVEVDEDLAVDAPLPLHLVAALASAGVDALLVSHQPAVEQLARALVYPAGVPLPAGFRTATIVALEYGDGVVSWRPAWVVDPHHLPG